MEAWPRARIGIIVPSSNRQAEPDIGKHLPEDVVLHCTRMRMTGPYHQPVTALLPRIREAAGFLADAKCDVIVFHCTASSMEEGPEGDQAIRTAITEVTGKQAITTASAIIDALATLDIRRLALLAPYDPSLTDPEAVYLERAGYEMLRVRSMALQGSDSYCGTPPEYWLRTASEPESWDPAAEAMLLSCANIRCFEVIDAIEERLARPLVTSNQAVLWRALRLCGAQAPIPGLGALLRLGG